MLGRLALLTALAAALFAALGAQPARSASVSELARQLAADTSALADARRDLATVSDDLESVTQRRTREWARLEGRLVIMYKHGTSASAIARLAGEGSMRDVGATIEAIGHVAESDAAAIRSWVRLDARYDQLRTRRASLRGTVKRTERAVRTSRAALSSAEAAAQRAREEAQRLARIQESPLLPRVTSPETTVVSGVSEQTEAAPEDPQPVGFVQSGVASVYSTSFTGEQTANGESYDPGAFTAAHPSLPFGTWVTVAGPGGSVAVRINDRGPFVGGRIIDLSSAAASAISLGGLASVTVSVDA